MTLDMNGRSHYNGYQKLSVLVTLYFKETIKIVMNRCVNGLHVTYANVYVCPVILMYVYYCVFIFLLPFHLFLLFY